MPRRQQVRTVTGPVDLVDLGSVLPHEHVLCASAGFARSWAPSFGGRSALVEIGTNGLVQARRAGVGTIVDATPFDLGRDVEILAEVSVASGVNVVASTGHWLVPAPATTARSSLELARFFHREITEGIDGTDIRAGVIKIASESEVTEFDLRVLDAAAEVSLETGTPILTHAGVANRLGLVQADLLEARGIAPETVMIGHCDDTTDLQYLVALAERGYYVGMDRIPCGALPEYGGQGVQDRLEMIARLVDAGFGDRVMMSHDDPLWAALLPDADQKRHADSNPWRLAFIHEVAIPRLTEMGVGPSAIHQMTVTNPANWLGYGTND